MKINFYKPKDFQDALDAYKAEMMRKPCIFDLSGTDEVTAQRIADFVEGLVFANNGKVERLSNTAFIAYFGFCEEKIF